MKTVKLSIFDNRITEDFVILSIDISDLEYHLDGSLAQHDYKFGIDGVNKTITVHYERPVFNMDGDVDYFIYSSYDTVMNHGKEKKVSVAIFND